MALVEWSADYESGNAQVDEQHRELFRMVNELHQQIVDGRGKEAIQPTLDKVASYTKEHFATEEALMQRSAYPEYKRHHALHQELLKRAADIIEGYRSGKIVLSITLSRFLADWIKKHIGQEDMKMIRYLRSQQDKDSAQ